MKRTIQPKWGCLAMVLLLAQIQFGFPSVVNAAGVTTSVHLVKYETDGLTVSAERTVDYQWMEKNLPVIGDGQTHYYHQGPVFEGDPWDPDEMVNLKDKGAVKGTAVKDLCELIGGMENGDELMLVSIDKWHTEFAYSNIYTPQDIQGVIALCWFNGADAREGESIGIGYPANNGFSAALQMVFISAVTNREGKHVFGNNDMRIALPQEKYQHFFEGQYPSTNGLSGKWINEIRIYKEGTPQNVNLDLPDQSHELPPNPEISWLPRLLAIAGAALIGLYFLIRSKGR